MKRCSKCKKMKPIEDFYNNKYNKNGKKSECKKCSLIAQRIRRSYCPPKRWIVGTEPKIGDKINAQKLGYKVKSLMIWESCPLCKSTRWIRYQNFKKGIHLLCRSCAKYGDRNKNWNGGRSISPNGYILTWLPKDSPFCPMISEKRGRILEHRLIMAQHLNRCLSEAEIVHHINGIRNDNRIENLELISNKGKHNTHNDKQTLELIREIKKLNKIIANQKREIELYKHQVKGNNNASVI